MTNPNDKFTVEHREHKNHDWQFHLKSAVVGTGCAIAGFVRSIFESKSTGLLTSGGLVLIALQVSIVAAAGIYVLVSRGAESKVLRTETAGFAIASAQNASLMDRGSVETDQGFYFLVSPMSVKKRRPLTVEHRADGARYLCEVDHQCTKIL